MQRMNAKVAVTGLKLLMLQSPIAGHDTNKLCNSPAMNKTEPVLQLYIITLNKSAVPFY
jgi:hypothetical protein